MMGKNVLLVEGTDDEHVVRSLLRFHGLDQVDEIVDSKGKDQLLESFPVRLKESGIVALGVVIDADTDLLARWHSLRDRLSNAGFEGVPISPARDGLLLEAPSGTLLPRVGVWLMPNNQTTGILEDFLHFLVPSGDLLFAHVENSLASIPAGEKRFSPQMEPKALIHTWLSWQAEPGKPLGQSITAKYLDANVPEAKVFVKWLQRVFFQRCTVGTSES